MRHVSGILAKGVTVVSLVLGVLLSVLWAGSYRVERRWGFATSAGRYTFHSLWGRVVVTGPPPEVPGTGAARRDATVLRRVVNDQFYFQRLRHGFQDKY